VQKNHAEKVIKERGNVQLLHLQLWQIFTALFHAPFMFFFVEVLHGKKWGEEL